jgi:hypothetical protein
MYIYTHTIHTHTRIHTIYIYIHTQTHTHAYINKINTKEHVVAKHLNGHSAGDGEGRAQTRALPEAQCTLLYWYSKVLSLLALLQAMVRDVPDSRIRASQVLSLLALLVPKKKSTNTDA